MNKGIVKSNKTCIINDIALDFFFNSVGLFNHYQYFTKELYRKLKDYKNVDEAEVKCAFLSNWCYSTLGIITYPVGMSWSTPCGDKESFDRYIESWKPIFDDFERWCSEQR